MSQGDQKKLPLPYSTLEQVPIKYEQRSCTDLFCTVIGLLFSIILIIFAFTLFNYCNSSYNIETYVKANFPTDSDGNLCGVDAPGYPLVYFANAPQISRRVCVSSCPTSSDTQLNCLMTENIGCQFNNFPGFQVNKYDSTPYVAASIGSYCLPTDQSLQDQLLENANLSTRITFLNTLDIIVLSLLFSFGLSIIFLIFVQCCPKFMNKAVIVLGCLVILALSLCLFFYFWTDTGKWIIASLLLVLFLIIVLSSCKNRRALNMNGVFLQAGTRMLSKSKCCTFFYIPVFIAFLTGFLFMIIYEFRSFWAGGQISFDPNQSVFYEFTGAGPIVLTVFLVIQGIWGFSFLKQAFNYLVSGNAVSWYYLKEDNQWSCLHPLKTLILKHFGSVVGGSFMTGFFTIGDYLLDILKPSVDSKKSGIHYKLFNTCCGPCDKVFDLVRSDAMAYINIAGNPYCNAARYCDYISDQSVVLEEAQSTSISYRICAHMLIAGIVSILCLYVKGSIMPIFILLIMVLSVFISTFFISIHADAGEAISISFMDNEECEKRRLGNQASTVKETTFDNMAVMHEQIAQEVKKVLTEFPNLEESAD